jgi:hypothetical protein
MKQKTIFSFACIFSLVYNIYSLDLFEIKDKKYLNSVNKIAIVQVDTVSDFSGDLPQGYYINLFLSMLSLGMNGITAFEMVTDSAAADMLLYVKFLTLFYSSKKNPQASNISYTTKATIQIIGYAPGTRREVFIMKHTGSSSSYTLPDELKDNIIEIGDNVVKAFSELKETAARKSFYVNTISCKELADKKISFILLGNKRIHPLKSLRI